MPDSALVLAEKLSVGLQYSDMILEEGAVANLFESQISELKKNVALTNVSYSTTGTGVKLSAMTLSNIKKNTPPKNWKALIEGGGLNFSKSVAIDLVVGWEYWLSDSSIPDTMLANFSARSIGKIGRAISKSKDPAKLRAKVSEAVSEAGKNGLSESQVTKLLGKGKVKVNKTAAGKKAEKQLDPSASKQEAIDHFKAIIDTKQADLDRASELLRKSVMNNQNKAAEIGRLKEQIQELKNAA